tara:strand:+ start:74 stop:4081 length:4008 start_codon:yes stop_codon:yes gene_type:complete
MIYIILLISSILFAEHINENQGVGERFSAGPSSILNREIGQWGYPDDPMIDRAQGFLLRGSAKTKTSNYGNYMDWDYNPSGMWKNYGYLPKLGFMAGVRGHRYSSEFTWQEADMASICSEFQSSWCEQYIDDINVWCSEDLYDSWGLDQELLVYQDGDSIHPRPNGEYVGIVFETQDDRGTVGTRKNGVPAILNMSDYNQWVFDFSSSDSGDSRVCISASEGIDPNDSNAMIGVMYPWGLRPSLSERLEQFDLYDYGPDGQEYTADDSYAYYGATVSESWFTRWNPTTNSDWHASTGSRGESHSGEVVAGDLFADTYFSNSGDDWPLLAHGQYPETWANSIWPGWWSSLFNPELPLCDDSTTNWHCWEENEGAFTSDNDVYMIFDDRWAHRGNMVVNNVYQQTGYPMGVQVTSQMYTYSVPFLDDVLIVDSKIKNESHNLVMPDGTKLVGSNGFNYKDMSIGFYVDADVLTTALNGSLGVHTNEDDFMEYIDCKTSRDYYPITPDAPTGCPIINDQELRISLAVFGDWDGQSGSAYGFAMNPNSSFEGPDFGLVAIQMLDSPIATDEIDLDNDGWVDIYPGDKLKMTDWHWFDWYNRPGVTFREGPGGCCSGDVGKDQALNKEEIMYKIMVGDTTNLSEDEKEWFFHADPLLDDVDPMFNPHFDSVEDLTQTNLFLEGPDGLDCVMMMNTGTFSLAVGDSTSISFAVIYGNNYDDLLMNAEVLQLAYNQNFLTVSAPNSPGFDITENQNSILIDWDDLSENSIDRFTQEIDFEGYKVYRSMDGGITWGDESDKIYDDTGVHVGWQPIAQFDYTLEQDIARYGSDISGYDPITPWVYLGSNTGLEYSYTDLDVLPYQEYCYVVTAYDVGIPLDFEIPIFSDVVGSLESPRNNMICGSPTGYQTEDIIFVESSWNIGQSTYEYALENSTPLDKRLRVEVEAKIDSISILNSAYLNPVLYTYEINSDGDPVDMIDLAASISDIDSISGLPGVEILLELEDDFTYRIPEYLGMGTPGDWFNSDGLYLNIEGYKVYSEYGDYFNSYFNYFYTNSWGMPPQEVVWHNDYIENLDFRVAYAQYDNSIPLSFDEYKPWFDYEITFGEAGIDTAYCVFDFTGLPDCDSTLTLLPFRIENISSGQKVKIEHHDTGANDGHDYDYWGGDEIPGAGNRIYNKNERIVFLEQWIDPDNLESIEYTWELRLDWDGVDGIYPWDHDISADIVTPKPLHDEDYWIFQFIDTDELSNNLDHLVPSKFVLHNPYPNPFNPVTHISYDVSKISNIAFIVYDINGRVVDQIEKGVQSPGYHSFDWNASRHSSGIYFIRMLADGFSSSIKKVTLIK